MTMTDINDQWYTFFTTTRLIFFLTGMFVSWVWHWWRAKKGKELIFDWSPTFVLAGLITIVFIAMQQVALSAEVRDCQEAFDSALRKKSELLDKYDLLTEKELETTSEWIVIVNTPPVEIMESSSSKVLYDLWLKEGFAKYQRKIDDIYEKKEALQKEREQLKFPSSICK